MDEAEREARIQGIIDETQAAIDLINETKAQHEAMRRAHRLDQVPTVAEIVSAPDCDPELVAESARLSEELQQELAEEEQRLVREQAASRTPRKPRRRRPGMTRI